MVKAVAPAAMAKAIAISTRTFFMAASSQKEQFEAYHNHVSIATGIAENYALLVRERGTFASWNYSDQSASGG